MVEPIEVVIGLFLAGLALLELTGKTDLLGRQKRQKVLERHRESLGEEDDGPDDGPRF
jgi:hypothetical protein